MIDPSKLKIISNSFYLILKGLNLTLMISGLSIILGIMIGFLIGIYKSRYFKKSLISQFFSFYIAFLRGTPLFVQLLFCYFAIPEAFNFDIDPIFAGVLTLSLNASAYIAEMVRAGINSVDESQWMAGQALGYSKYQALVHLIIPQSLCTILPSLAGELATIIKESSVLMIIGVPEMLKVGKDLAARNLMPLEIYSIVGILYFVVTFLLGHLAKITERKFQWN